MKLLETWRRWKAAWRLRLHQQITRAGLAYVLALLLVALAAFVSGNNLLFLILAAMLSTFLISGFVSRLGLAGLEVDLLLPQHTSARRKVRAVVRLRNLKTWVPSFSIRLALSRHLPQGSPELALYFPVIPGGASVEESVDLYFPHRGAHKERSFEFSTGFPFGFVERRESVTIRHEVLVYPCLDPQPGFNTLLAAVSGEMEAMQRGRGNDFYRIRPYELSESARHVDWKATAHTGALQIREFAREQDRRVVIYLDLDIPAGAENWFESVVECAAFLAFELSQRDTSVRLVSQEFDLVTPEAGDIYTILKYLALVSPRKGKPQVVPDDTNCYQIVLTHNLELVLSLGWCAQQPSGGRILGPDFQTRL
ncbi:MAG: DUF58 domain-containing protein [Acidobacteriota bacterium]